MVEMMLASTVMMVGVASYLSAIVQVDSLRSTSEETGRAIEGAKRALGEVQSSDFADLVALYDANPDNDPGGAGSAPGNSFTVDGLARRTAPNEPVGEIVLPLDAAGALREDLDMPELGLPRDLNGDGAIDSADHSGDYQLLPVLVRVRWEGRSENTVELKTLLSER